ncbi:MAG: hypothetical protein WA960_15100 [Tunicatimonas sp.]
MIDSSTLPPDITYPDAWHDKPFFALTLEMLNCVRDHNFSRLEQICDDDFGIVDIDTEGGSRIIRNQTEWAAWFTGLFQQLDGMKAVTWSEITGYEALKKQDMGYSVVDFDQLFVVGEKRMRFSVIAIIIWKRTGDVWQESRYHGSLIRVIEED